MAVTEMLTIISLFAILLPAAAMVREKEKGTASRLPAHPFSDYVSQNPVHDSGGPCGNGGQFVRYLGIDFSCAHTGKSGIVLRTSVWGFY